MPRFPLCFCLSLLMSASALSLPVSSLQADMVSIVNAGFEDTSGQSVFNEFTFGTPVGWTLYDPSNIEPSPGVFVGTLEPNGVEFFNSTAPEGDRVAILFNSTREGDGEYGFEQTLGEALIANTTYNLSVEVGNIASGTDTGGTFYNLDEFPGYRVELLAGGTVIAADNNGLTIPEAEFSTSTVSFTTRATHPLLGQNLGIRLVSLNQIPAGYTQATSPDLEVDFDDVRLSRVAVPEPNSLTLLAISFTFLFVRKRIS